MFITYAMHNVNFTILFTVYIFNIIKEDFSSSYFLLISRNQASIKKCSCNISGAVPCIFLNISTRDI